ncbi:hypothetical protein [Massilia sp. CF038]|uniref:hypothetical protein n=1 Tax=Massilia sp. CF038 TaxID=1881045 RepID=UPI00091B1559|nr:hypothetical protein [Massilia sp. CF038]SHH17715.1 hypothetical protein SAMN05428948_3164 [Massilia sp. CF038]
MAFDIGNLLQQYLGGAPNVNAGRALDDFDQVAQNAPRASVAQGVTEALRSDQTPPFAHMVSQLFDKSDATQRAGMLNQMLRGIGPGTLASLAGGALSHLFRGNESPAALTPEQAAQMTPDQVRQIAEDAQQQDPGIVERMGDFYAEHPTLVKTIGGAALAIVLGRVAEGMRH